jgi:hypothetical protein
MVLLLARVVPPLAVLALLLAPALPPELLAVVDFPPVSCAPPED